MKRQPGNGTLLVAAAALAWACSAPALQKDLAQAEHHEKAGRIDLALQYYERAQVSCKEIRADHLRRQTCGQAHIQRAELLAHEGRKREAAEAYEGIPAELEDDPIQSAKAIYRAGRLWLELGREKHGYRLLWKTVTDYPDVAYAIDALRLVVLDGRERNAQQLYLVLAGLVEPLAGNDVSDNILYAMARLAEEELSDDAAALAHLDQIIETYPEGGVFDEACWHAARLARSQGYPERAVDRLEKLLATREVAIGAGSYFSVWLDNAQLELGIVLRDELAEHDAAIASFRQLIRDYPDSILHDDATYQAAVTFQRSGEPERACAELARLAETWPDSKYEIRKAPELRRELGCDRDRSAESR